MGQWLYLIKHQPLEAPKYEPIKGFFKDLSDYRTIRASDYRSDPGVFHTQRCYGINGTHPGSVRMFHIVNNDNTSLNILLNIVYCKNNFFLKTNAIVYIY